MGYRHPTLWMLAMHVPLPALAIVLLAGGSAGDGWLLAGGLVSVLVGLRAIADLWTSDAVDEERRPLWVAAMFLVAPLALPAYWWLHVRHRAPTRFASQH